MARNKLIDLNNHLFEQMERLNDESLPKEQLYNEIDRARAMTGLASQIIQNAALGLKAEKFKTEYSGADISLPVMLEAKNLGVYMGRKSNLWTQEMKEYFLEIVVGKNASECAELINKKFGTSITPQQVRYFKANNGIRSNFRDNYKPISTYKLLDEHKEFIRNNYVGISNNELTNRLNEKFETGFTARQVQIYKNKNGFKSGVTGYFEKGHIPPFKGKKLPPELYEKASANFFKKGHVPHNVLPFGSESVIDGYRYVKLENVPNPKSKGNWVMLHRKVWEDYYGEIPKGYAIVFLDGNKMNVNIENLALVKNTEMLKLHRKHLAFEDAELTKIGINIVKVMEAARLKEIENDKR
jgi:hypothetical protein